MEILSSVDELIHKRKSLKGDIGFVPTMGALHKGHLSLIEKSKAQNDTTIVSIFVNPTQFLPGEDFEKYPRKLEADRKICELAGVDILFVPDVSQMYHFDEVLVKAPRQKGFILEGHFRPGHFDGVLQVVNKLFHIVKPTRAYFGKKDAQQLFLIKKMVQDFFWDIQIVPCDIVRDSDGLALSSRNAYLSKEERERALLIPKSLKRAAKMVQSGIMDAETITKEMLKVLEPLKVEYVAIVDREFEAIDEIVIGNSIILVAAYVGSTRLIDNIWL